MTLNRIITILCLLGGMLAFILALVFGAYVPAILSAFLFFLSLFIWKYGYLLIPYFTKAANIVEVRGEYIIPPTRDYILKKSEGRYYATKFLEILFYESTLDKNKEGRHFLFESIERALGSLKQTVKIGFLLSPIDLSSYSDNIKTKRSEAEAKKSKISEQSPDIVRLDREIAMWNRLLERISSGEKPMEIITYATTTASGATKDEAVMRVKRLAQEIKTILSSTLHADVNELSDLDMIKCFEWEYFVPERREDFLDEVF